MVVGEDKTVFKDANYQITLISSKSYKSQNFILL